MNRSVAFRSVAFRAVGPRTAGTRLGRCALAAIVFAFAAIAVVVWPTPLLGAAPLSENVTVRIDPPSSSVVLGETIDLALTVSNLSDAATPSLVVHLDITDPSQGASVDPEDWSPTLTRAVGAVAPGESVNLNWQIQPISAGTFATYAVALSPGLDSLAASNVVAVSVTDQRSLNPGGILPIAIAAPAILGGLLLVQVRFARRSRKPVEPELS